MSPVFPSRVKECLLTLSLGQSCKSSSAVPPGDVKSSSNEHISQVAFTCPARIASSPGSACPVRRRANTNPARRRSFASDDPLCLSYESAARSCRTPAHQDARKDLFSADSCSGLTRVSIPRFRATPFRPTRSTRLPRKSDQAHGQSWLQSLLVVLQYRLLSISYDLSGLHIIPCSRTTSHRLPLLA